MMMGGSGRCYQLWRPVPSSHSSRTQLPPRSFYLIRPLSVPFLLPFPASRLQILHPLASPLSTRALSLSSLVPLAEKVKVDCGLYVYDKLISGIDWKAYTVSLSPVFVAIGVSYRLCIGLEREIQVAVLRSFVQMLALGLLLKVFFEGNPLWNVVGIVIMVLLAGSTAGDQSKMLPRSQTIATASLAFGTLGTIFLSVLLQVLSSEPGSLLVVTGHVLGNSMITVGRTLQALHYEVTQHTGQVESALALGASPYQACHSYIRHAFVFGIAPMVDALKVMGLVSLPGNMTGLLIGGATPLEAAITQIKIVNILLGAASISSMIAIFMAWPMLFTPTCQLWEKR